MRKLIAIVAVTALLGVLSTAAGISVFPLVQELLLPPGTSYSNTIQVENVSEEPVKITVQVVGFMAPEGIPQFLDPAQDRYPFSGKDLLTIEPAQQEVLPGETATFHYTVTMPADLDPYGGRYLAAVFRAEPVEVEAGAQVVVTAQVASLFLIDPGGEAAPHLKAADIKAYPSVDDPHKIVLEALVTNDGNLHISSDQIRGYVYITDEDGYVVDEFAAHTHTVLPGNAYIHREVWQAPQDLPSGKYYLHLGLVLFAPDPEHPQHLFITAPITLKF